VSARAIHGLAIVLGGVTLVLVGQPLYANDSWVHLALGSHFAAEGPWLAADPHLFAAPGPPSPSSWLGAVGLSQVSALSGFAGLRLFHVLAVAGILALAWSVVRRASGSTVAASAGLVGFIVLSTYRLVQLRPELFSIAATLALFLLLVVPRAGPGTRASGAAIVLSLVWANSHAAFLLGPVLILGVAASLWAFYSILGGGMTGEERQRARRLAATGGLMLLASLVNPQGWDAHLAYFTAGGETLALAAVSDEWNPLAVWRFPTAGGPPTWAVWLMTWICLISVAAGATRLVLERGAAREGASTGLDPALVALAFAGSAAALIATRFVWLQIFGLALAAALLARARAEGRSSPGGPAAGDPSLLGFGRQRGLALASLFLVGLHFGAGDFPQVSRSLRSGFTDYRAPYDAGRFSSHAVWFLRDSGLSGRIHNPYPLGGFMSYWLSPEITMSASGAMNVRREAMETDLAVGMRLGMQPGESYANVLDRQGYDLFLGVGLPVEVPPNGQVASTVRHVERERDWVPVFRSLASAVYLRRNERNAANLERVRRYYEREGVPFDPQRGFDPAAVIAQSPAWATAHGVIPRDFADLVAAVVAEGEPNAPREEVNRLANLFATLGLYEEAMEIDRVTLARASGDWSAARRMIWGLLQQGRWSEARRASQTLDRENTARGQTSGWSESVELIVGAEPERRAAYVALMPLMQASDVPPLRKQFVSPVARAAR
jgi:hypothetical protein